MKGTINKKMFTFAILFILILSSLIVSIRNTSADNQVQSDTFTSLTFEDLNSYWNNNGVRLTNSYVDMNLTAKQVFVPDELSDLTEHFTYSMQEWHENKARFWVTLTYLTSYCGWAGNPQIYPSQDLDTILGNSQWTGSEYPNNRFQISNKEVWATNKTDRGYVCDIDSFVDTETGFNVSWDINIHSYYYHVIIDYNLYYIDKTNSTQNKQLVYSFQDIYSGERPEFVILDDFNIKKIEVNPKMVNGRLITGLKDRVSLDYDNLYGDDHAINVTIAYPSNKENDFLGFYASDIYYQYENDLFSIVTDYADNSNMLNTIPSNPSNFIFKSYKVNISKDSIEHIYYEINSTDELSNDLYIWVTVNPWGGGGGASGDWGDYDWDYRKKITIDSGQVPSTLTNYPLLVSITDTDLRDNAQSDGDDILFATDTGTKLNHEIEKWVSGTGELIAWVNITSLAHDSDTEIYMYYGNSGASNQENIIGTWDTGDYLAVWHCNDASGSLTDSLGNYDGTASGTPAYHQTGEIGYGIDLDADTDYFTFSDTGYLDGDSDFMLFAFANSDVDSGENWIIQTRDESYTGFREKTGNLQFVTTDSGGQDNLDAGSYNTGQWYSHIGSYDADVGKTYYLDDALVSNTRHASFTAQSESNWIGSGNGATAGFDGTLDEVRITKFVSDSYVKTYYNNVNNVSTSFLSVGSEELSNILPSFTNPNPANNSIDQNLALTWNITIKDDDGDTFNWTIESSNGDSNSANGASNGSKSLSISGLAYDTSYTVWVNATDSHGWTNETFGFTTKENTPPSFTNLNPSGNGQNLTVTLSVDLSDLEGSTITYEFRDNSDDSVIDSGSGNNNTYQGTWSGLTENTSYSWYVNATDGFSNGSADSSIITFKTLNIEEPNTFLASANNDTKITLTWNKGSNASNTYIRYKTGSYPSSVTDGTFLYNNTGTTTSATGLNGDTTYYFRAWSYNDTTNIKGFSTEYINATNTTYPDCINDLLASVDNDTKITLTWTKGSGSDKTHIRYRIGAYPTDITNGTFLYNNTGTTTSATGLTPSITYYFRAWSWGNTKSDFALCNDSVNATTIEPPEAPSNMLNTTDSDTQITLTWTNGNYDKIKIMRKTGSYPTSVTDGTEVYFSTGTTYSDTGLTPSTEYYYRAWGYNVSFGGVYSTGYVNATNYTLPQIPQNIATSVISGSSVNITWTLGTGDDTVLLRKKTGSYPSSVTDGNLLQNTSALFYLDTSYSDTDYFAMWGYNSTSGYYSDKYELEIGSLVIYVYKENNPSISIGNYSIFISNNDATDTYENTSQNNPTTIDIKNVPSGDDITIQISKEGYNTRRQIIDLETNQQYNISFYLPASSSGSSSSESDEDWYVPPEEDENVLITDIFSVDNYLTDETKTLQCSPESIENVYIYNDTIYGGWIDVSSDKYTLSGETVTIDSSILDKNITMIRVLYYCNGGQEYSEHYIITVIDEISSPVDNAYITIKKYINTTDEYEDIIKDYSDSSGQIGVDLVPNTVYYIVITEDSGDYKNSSSFWSPSEVIYGEDATKTFILEYADTEDIPPDNPSECIALTGEISSNILYVNFTNVCDGTTENIHIIVYETNSSNDTNTFFNEDSCILGCDSFSTNFSNINNSNSYIIKAFFNNTYWENQTQTIVVHGSNYITSKTTGVGIDNTIGVIFGFNDFGWQNLIMWVIIAVACLYSDAKEKNVGWVLIALGFITLFLNIYIGFDSAIGTLAGGAIPILFIIVGVIAMWRGHNKS